MLPATLDNIFPFVVLGYGAIVTGVLHSPLSDLAADRLPERMAAQLFAHRGLALLCVAVGAPWCLQSIWVQA